MKDGTETTKHRRRRTLEERIAELRKTEAKRAMRRQETLVKAYKEAVPVRDRAVERASESQTKVFGIIDEFATLVMDTEGLDIAEVTVVLKDQFESDDVELWLSERGEPLPDDETSTDGDGEQLSINDN